MIFLAPDSPDPEFRSMFVATAFNVDFPTSPYDSTADQEGQLDDYVATAADINFNAIMFQVSGSNQGKNNDDTHF